MTKLRGQVRALGTPLRKAGTSADGVKDLHPRAEMRERLWALRGKPKVKVKAIIGFRRLADQPAVNMGCPVRPSAVFCQNAKARESLHNSCSGLEA